MKTILILGAGTAGTAIAHKLRRRLSSEWDVAVVDPSSTHLYQPGLLFLPFGDETEERIVRERGSTLGKGITWHKDAVKAIDTERRRVELDEGEPLSYDFLIIASGTEVRPDMIDGMLGDGWRKSVFDFNYDTEPLPGQFPIPGIGPLPLLKECRRNHWAKRLFRLVYWHGLLPARPIPISPTMSLAGKRLSAVAEAGGA